MGGGGGALDYYIFFLKRESKLVLVCLNLVCVCEACVVISLRSKS